MRWQLPVGRDDVQEVTGLWPYVSPLLLHLLFSHLNHKPPKKGDDQCGFPNTGREGPSQPPPGFTYLTSAALGMMGTLAALASDAVLLGSDSLSANAGGHESA